MVLPDWRGPIRATALDLIRDSRIFVEIVRWNMLLLLNNNRLLSIKYSILNRQYRVINAIFWAILQAFRLYLAGKTAKGKGIKPSDIDALVHESRIVSDSSLSCLTSKLAISGLLSSCFPWNLLSNFLNFSPGIVPPKYR